jgi:hypothetical protein
MSTTFTYTYTYSEHFLDGLDSRQLNYEIENSSLTTLFNIKTVGENVKIVFDSPLSTVDKMTLDSIISSHVPNSSKIKGEPHIFYPKNNKVKTAFYAKVGILIYGGSNSIGTINFIETVSWMDPSIDSYNIRIIDKTNGKIVVETEEISNTVEQIVDLGTVSNIPKTDTIFEIQAKRNGGTNESYVHIDIINFYYSN